MTWTTTKHVKDAENGSSDNINNSNNNTTRVHMKASYSAANQNWTLKLHTKYAAFVRFSQEQLTILSRQNVLELVFSFSHSKNLFI